MNTKKTSYLLSLLLVLSCIKLTALSEQEKWDFICKKFPPRAKLLTAENILLMLSTTVLPVSLAITEPRIIPKNSVVKKLLPLMPLVAIYPPIRSYISLSSSLFTLSKFMQKWPENKHNTPQELHDIFDELYNLPKNTWFEERVYLKTLKNLAYSIGDIIKQRASKAI